MFDITPIVQAAAVLIATVITYILVPYIRSKTTISQQKEINNWVAIAVQAAEQIYKGSGLGRAKKAYVLEWLKEHNIAVDDTKIDAMIESAVHELNNGLIAVETTCEVLDAKDGDENE